jgi:signal-transduction protein with cAMP-binding, CBS, and nucleotidyltransferase domain
MLAKDLISDVVPALRTSDTGLKALSYMDIFRVSHLPIVNNTEFLGLISDKDIYDLNMAEEPIGNHTLSLIRPYVIFNQHIFEVIELATRLELTVIPVLDEKNSFLGVITQQDLLQYFAELTAVKHPGGIIVLELNVNDYSLSQIAQIVESNDTKILSLYISTPLDSTHLNVTLKLNRTDLTSVIQTFIRYNYNIKASYSDADTLTGMYENRYEMFMRYLNV